MSTLSLRHCLRAAAAAVAVAAVGLGGLSPAIAGPVTTTSAPASTGDGSPLTAGDSTAEGRSAYPGDAETEAAYVASEDERLVKIRTVDSLAQLSNNPLKAPYRLATGSSYTLVLTSRKDAYTVKDLLALGPQTFVRQPDGSYLLSENLVILTGATLNLTGSGGVTLRLASDADGFVSIVNYGGRLNMTGAEGAPVVVSSFDRKSNAADRLTDDGRAYIRSIGGQVLISHAQISDLGFWSGRTGGLSLTGTDRPSSGALSELGETMRVGKRADRERAAAAAAAPKKKAAQGLSGKGRASVTEVLPAGALPVPVVSVDSPQYSFVSASITDTTVERNAFGVFVSSANGLNIRKSSFEDNLVDGLVMHRYVINAVIESSTANGNGGDGFMLARATTGIVMSQNTANENDRNGMTLSGLPLADGPSATGTSVGSYGNNSVSNSEMSRNKRYGVEVVGGVNIGILSNNVDSNGVGVVVRERATKVNVVGNRVRNSRQQGISLRDGVVGATVTGNIVSGGETGVYVRDSQAEIERNTLTDGTLHAVSLVGNLGPTSLTENTISGHGPSAIEAKRAVDLHDNSWANDESGWDDTTPLLVTLKRFLQPLTMMWLILGLLLVFTAVHGSRARRRKAHPYGDKAPVSDGIAISAASHQSVGTG